MEEKYTKHAKPEDSNGPFYGKEESKAFIEVICNTSWLIHKGFVVLLGATVIYPHVIINYFYNKDEEEKKKTVY